MKYYYLLFAILALMLNSCDTNGEFIDEGYNEVGTSFMPQNISSNYRVTFNGKESPYIGKGEEFVKIEVFEKNSDSEQPILVENNWSVSQPITFVQSLGEKLGTYSKEEYLEFTPAVVFSENATNYSVQFESYELQLGSINYIAKEDLPGTLSIKNKADNQQLYSEEITVNSPQTFTIIQLSTTDFLGVNEENKPEDPEVGTFKVRFLYTQDAFPDYPELKLVLYYMSLGFDQFSDPVATITLKANELSEYVTINQNYFNEGTTYGIFDLIDPNDESNYIVNNLDDLDPSIDYTLNSSNKYKFLTFRFTDMNHTGHNGVRTNWIPALNEEW